MFKSHRKWLIVLLVVFFTFGFVGCKSAKDPDDDDDDIIDYTDLSVREAFSTNGMVASANPYASKVGLDILKEGGNAFDAIVAISFALGVVEPNASGLGGGGVMTGYDASTGEYLFYNFREFVPAAGNVNAFPNRSADLSDGPLASGVPMQVDGLLTILENHGAMSRSDVIQPAIDYARNGVKVTPELANAIIDQFSKLMRMRAETAPVYTSDGIMPLVADELLVQENLANTLEKVRDLGRDGFYKGEVADAIVATMEKTGGLITYADLEKAIGFTKRGTAAQGSYRGYDIVTVNAPSSGGITLVETLNMLEYYGELAPLGHNSAEYINVISTAMQLAYGDKRRYVADDTFVDIPLAGLLSKAYAAERWNSYYTPGQAFTPGGYSATGVFGNPWAYMPSVNPLHYEASEVEEHYSTTSFSVVDKYGNVASITQTINYFFGNGVVIEDCGIHMNNQLSSFSFTTTSVALIQPGKQPVTHMMPTIIMKDGDPVATIGSPGSMRIPAAVIQVVLNMIDFDMDIQTAIEQPRVFCYAKSNDEYSMLTKDLDVERGIPESVRAELELMGYHVVVRGTANINLYFGGAQGITIDHVNKILHGGADPRRDGKALGY